MKFCSNCGATVALRVPAGDNVPRHVCEKCGSVHYLNPKIVVGAIPEWEDRILLCRRAIEPRHGFWTLPSGFMENAETTAQAAARETLEEACARIEVGELFTLINVPHISQVHIVYRARLLDLDFRAGDESLEVGLFSEDEIPWDEIAFRTIALTLRHYFADRRHGSFRFHTGDITLPPPVDIS
jgi:ADP-ribose pyrophosphatase YjhB (NUDIX family)